MAAVIAKGKAGGTVIVIKSKHLSTISEVGYPYLIIAGIADRKPIKAITAIAAIKSMESL